MGSIASPLRYPGGKSSLLPLISSIIQQNRLGDCCYVEPFAGGAGLALGLLFREYVSSVMINDLDKCVYAFWKSIFTYPDKFIGMIEDTPVNIEEWKRQRYIYHHYHRYSRIKVGFATFYLNRCNRSGILMGGGPIGGYHQSGKWKLDVRFNKPNLIKRIERVVDYAGRIEVFNLDAMEFIQGEVYERSKSETVFVYLDPPYYDKGPELYFNAFDHYDHHELAKHIKRIKRYKWMVTYDNVKPIQQLYHNAHWSPFDLRYTAGKKRIGSEVMIHHPDLVIPNNITQFLEEHKRAS